MVRSKPKREKPAETLADFITRVSKSPTRTNGLKKNLKGARR